MNVFLYSCIALTLGAILFSAWFVIYNRTKIKHTLKRIDEMLQSAIDGSFSEHVFDESMLSAAETKLSRYLASREAETGKLAKEKDKIKELISDISHQTKTPLANILLYAQLLAEQELSEESSHCVEALSAQANKLNFLVGSLVKTSRMESGILALHPKQEQIQPLLHRVVEQIMPEAKAKQVTIEVELTEAAAVFDQKWTGEAIYNIVDNAVKYVNEGGHIQISCKPYQLFCRIDITDDGIGIAESEQAKVFGRFYRSSKVSHIEGVGIGLYLCREILSGEGGYMKLTSQEGIGTTFSVFLPMGG